MNRLRACITDLAKLKITNYKDQRHISRWVAPTQMELTRRKKRLPPQPLPKRYTFIEWNRSAEVYAFNQRLSEQFKTEKLEEALTCKEYIFEEERKQQDMGISDFKLELQHNERLINRGKELTSEVVRKYLIKNLPDVPKSGIMVFHDYLMSEEVLAKASLHIGTKDLILTVEHPVTEKTLAQIFLALVAALAESVDVNHASIFVRDFLIVALGEKDLTEIWCPSQPMELLNDILSKENKAPVEPRIISHAGKNTILSSYHIGVYTDKKFLGSGFGQTLEEAKDVAATNALCRMFGLLDSSRTIKFNTKIDMTS